MARISLSNSSASVGLAGDAAKADNAAQPAKTNDKSVGIRDVFSLFSHFSALDLAAIAVGTQTGFLRGMMQPKSDARMTRGGPPVDYKVPQTNPGMPPMMPGPGQGPFGGAMVTTNGSAAVMRATPAGLIASGLAEAATPALQQGAIAAINRLRHAGYLMSVASDAAASVASTPPPSGGPPSESRRTNDQYVGERDVGTVERNINDVIRGKSPDELRKMGFETPEHIAEHYNNTSAGQREGLQMYRQYMPDKYAGAVEAVQRDATYVPEGFKAVVRYSGGAPYVSIIAQ